MQISLTYLIILAHFFTASAATAVPQSGTLRLRYNSEPFSLNPIVAEGFDSVEIQFYVMEGLLWINHQTNEWQPWLADRWTISKDKKIFDFHIRENAVWSDGKPVTSADVKFSFDVLFDNRYPTAHMRPYYQGIKRVIAIDRKTVRFETKSPYFGNFTSSAGLPVVPKHIYGHPKKGPKLHKTILGSGPYIIEKWNDGINIILKKNSKWWGHKDRLYRNLFNPERVVFQFVSDDNVALEMLKKGDLDFMYVNADQYLRLQKEKQRSYDLVRTSNLSPRGITSIGFNLKRRWLQDKRLRLALVHLLDRETMARTLFNNFVALATGPWYRQSEFADPDVREIQYDPVRASKLLRSAGWEDTDGDLILDKVIDGKKKSLGLQVITADKSGERILTMFKEDAKNLGVDIQIRFLSGSAFGPAVDKGDFDAAQFAGGAWLVNFDAKPWLHSKSTPPGGLNFSRYSNDKVDALLDKAHAVLDFEDRIPFMREVFRIVANDVAQIPLFNDRDVFYAVAHRVGRPGDTLKYDISIKSWWIKEKTEPVLAATEAAQ